jgi:muconolactone D-isomerase
MCEFSQSKNIKFNNEYCMEYLTDMVTMVPEGTTPVKVDELRAAEAERAAELAKAGHLVQLWRPPLGPGEWRSIGLFRAADSASQ